VPFEVCFWDPTDPGKAGQGLKAELRQDKQLPQKLRAEAPGILAWMVRGCLGWQREGLTVPAQVVASTAAYRQCEDTIGRFLGECGLTGRGVMRCKSSALYDAYRKWCEQNGEAAATQRTFGESMTERGFERQTSNGVWYLGVALREPEAPDGARRENHRGG
jgi:putative DNA primase/helicase